MASRSNNRNTGFENMKYEIASQVGVNLKEGYNGDLTSRDAGKVVETSPRKYSRHLEISIRK